MAEVDDWQPVAKHGPWEDYVQPATERASAVFTDGPVIAT
jgi:hypothetical protein